MNRLECKKGGQEGQAGGQAEDHAEGQGGQGALSAKDIAGLMACLDGAASAEALSAASGHSSRTGHFRRWLSPLLAGGFLELLIPDKPRSPAQKYRLTNKGRAAITPIGHEQTRGEVEGQAGGQAEGYAEGQEGQAALSAKEIAMLQACRNGALAAEALMAAAGHSSRTGHFRRRVKRLLSDGLLEKTVPDMPRSPTQKYRLTDKGWAAIGHDADSHEGFDD